MEEAIRAEAKRAELAAAESDARPCPHDTILKTGASPGLLQWFTEKADDLCISRNNMLVQSLETVREVWRLAPHRGKSGHNLRRPNK